MMAAMCTLCVARRSERRGATCEGNNFDWKLHIRGANKQRAGFTLIELTVVIIIVSLLFVAAAERFTYWEERAEKAAMESVLAGVKMGLQIRMAEMIMSNRQPGLGQLETENPMRWLQEPPPNYAGEYTATPKPGNWYYSVKEHELVYVPSSISHLEPKAGSRELRFRVAIRYENNSFSGGKSPSGVTLVTVRRFTWF